MDAIQKSAELLAQLNADEAVREAQAFYHSIRACLTVIAVASTSIAISLWVHIIIKLVKKESHDGTKASAREEGH